MSVIAAVSAALSIAELLAAKGPALFDALRRSGVMTDAELTQLELDIVQTTTTAPYWQTDAEVAASESPPPSPEDVARAQWMAKCTIGRRKADDWWVRWTSPADYLYYWLNPATNRWVTEPEQIGMPGFPTSAAAMAALNTAPTPPGA